MARLAIIGALLALSVAPPAKAQECEQYKITGYLKSAGNARTYDGTPIWTSEPIVAASWNVPIDSYVRVSGLGTYRVADRGSGLGSRHVDIPVDTLSEAYAITGWRQVCVL